MKYKFKQRKNKRQKIYFKSILNFKAQLLFKAKTQLQDALFTFKNVSAMKASYWDYCCTQSKFYQAGVQKCTLRTTKTVFSLLCGDITKDNNNNDNNKLCLLQPVKSNVRCKTVFFHNNQIVNSLRKIS